MWFFAEMLFYSFRWKTLFYHFSAKHYLAVLAKNSILWFWQENAILRFMREYTIFQFLHITLFCFCENAILFFCGKHDFAILVENAILQFWLKKHYFAVLMINSILLFLMENIFFAENVILWFWRKTLFYGFGEKICYFAVFDGKHYLFFVFA